MRLGRFQTRVTGSNSAGHQKLDDIAVCRVFGSQQAMC